MNISQPKPETAKRGVFSVSALYYFFKYLATDKTETTSCSVVYYEPMTYYNQIIDSVRLTKLKILLHDIFNARHNFTECNAHVITRIEAIVSLGFMIVRAENPCSLRYVVANWSRKDVASLPIIGCSFLTVVRNCPSDAMEKSCRWNSLLWLPLLFHGMEVRHEEQSKFTPLT